MAEVSAREVAALRKETGAGMMDCKKALAETGGDFEQARSWLRERNLAGASKRSGREAAEGAVEVIVDGNVGTIVELSCETDFVAKGDDFQSLLSAVAEAVLRGGAGDPAALELAGTSVGEAVKELSGKLGEKIELGRVVRYETTDGLLDGYRHVQADRGVIGVLVELGGVDAAQADAQDVAHDLALHVANSAPQHLTRDEVPADVVERERELLETQTRAEGKPEQALAKIVEGKLTGFYKQIVLVDQPFVKDPKTSVGELLGSLGPEARVTRFARVRVGED